MLRGRSWGLVLVALRAAAKENNLREPLGPHSVSVVEKASRSPRGPPRRYTRDLYLGAPADRDMTAWIVWERKDQLYAGTRMLCSRFLNSLLSSVNRLSRRSKLLENPLGVLPHI